MLGSLLRLNATLDDFDKDVVRGTIFRDALGCGIVEMD